MVAKIKLYVSQVVDQLKLTTWPTRSETINWTYKLVALTVVMTALVFAVDWLGSRIMQWII